MKLRILLLAAAALAASATAASARDGVVYSGHGYVVFKGPGGLSVTTPTHAAPRHVAGDAVAPGTFRKDTVVRARGGGLLLHPPGSDACPGGRFAVLDMDAAASRLLDAPCEKGTRVRLSGPANKPVAVVRDAKDHAARRISLR